MPRSIKRIAQQAVRADQKTRDSLQKSAAHDPLQKSADAHWSHAADSLQNFAAATGMGTPNLMAAGSYGFNPVSRIRTLCEWIHRGSWLGGVAIDLVADDMTRAGVEIKGELEPRDIERIQEAAVSMCLWRELNDVIKWSRLYGGSLGVLLVAGQDLATPFRLETVGKNGFRGIHSLDRWMVEPSLEDLVTDYGPQMGLPKFYTVRGDAPALNNKKIHYSRCLRMEGIRMPYYQRLADNMWGISILERLYDRMVAFDSATQGASQLAFKAYIRTYKIKGLRELIAAGGKGLQALMKQVAFMATTQQNEGITLLDGDDEFESSTAAAAFSGLDTLLMGLAQQLSGALQIPLTRLFGQSPGGLNSTGESDLRTYYDGINQQQELHLRSTVTTAYRAIAQSIGIKVPDGFRVEFRPLWQLTWPDKSAIVTATTEAILKVFEAGIVSQKIVLQELKQISTVTGVFTNITREDIEAADDVPVPPALPGDPQPGEEAPGAGGSEKTPVNKKTKDAAVMTKAETNYTDHGDPPELCGACKHFLEPKACELVQGSINPAGHCEEFVKTPARESVSAAAD